MDDEVIGFNSVLKLKFFVKSSDKWSLLLPTLPNVINCALAFITPNRETISREREWGDLVQSLYILIFGHQVKWKLK